MVGARGKRDERQGASIPEADDDNRKVRLILEAARKVFLTRGYDTSSTDLIARTAGVSKATLYVYFESKEALLFALVAHEVRHRGPGTMWEPEPGPIDVVVTLRRIAHRFTAFFLAHKGMGLVHLVEAQAARFPELGRIFYEAGPRKVHDEVASFLRAAEAQNLLAMPDVELAANQFLGLVRGELPLHQLLSLGPPSKETLEAQIESGIYVFLAAYGQPRPPHPERHHMS
jgi:TetR/AcrR family transcriptional repressor of mexJK operon